MKTLIILAGLVISSYALADTISFSGTITQTPADGGETAVNNPSLNNINDGDPFVITTTFSGSISSPGTTVWDTPSLVFSDPTAPAVENQFASESLTITQAGSAYDFSFLGCLSTGDGCLVGNYLSVNFSIPISGINSTNVPASLVPNLNPALDLLEDDANSEVQGSVNSYSYIAAPEPSQTIPLIAGLAAFCVIRRKK